MPPMGQALGYTSNPLQKNELPWTYFDQNTVATAAVNSSFFTNTQGKTPQNSNFPQNGRLAEGNEFSIDCVSVFVKPLNGATAGTVRDFHEILQGKCSIKYNGVPVWEGHGYRLPASQGITGVITDGAGAVAVHFLNNGFQAIGNCYRMHDLLPLRNESIEVLLEWSPAITLGQSTFVQVILDGKLYRKTS